MFYAAILCLRDLGPQIHHLFPPPLMTGKKDFSERKACPWILLVVFSKTTMSSEVEERDDEFEVLDLSDRGWLRKTFGDLSKASVAKQITVGGVSGWCAGYLFARVGKAAAAAVGGSLLLLQIAHHQGYIKINWNRVDRQMNRARRRLERDSDRILPWLAEEVSRVKDFASENVVLATGFAGGFFLGIAS